VVERAEKIVCRADVISIEEHKALISWN